MKSLALVTSNDDLVTKQYCDNNFVKINGGGVQLTN